MELVAPAGDLTKLKYALAYGADAAYCGVPSFSLRGRVNSFTDEDLADAAIYVHSLRRKIYFTYNVYPHNRELDLAKKHLGLTISLSPDALIVTDPGLLSYIRKKYPRVHIHVSTQANAINYGAVEFWKKQGVKRVILAREVTLAEAAEIKRRVKGMELEYFVHGAMCMAISGRCLLSSWMNARSANSGDCTQPCRWPWEAVEDKEKRTMILEEDAGGTYFLNSKDLCLIEKMDEIERSGIAALKIEGRNKSLYYLATVIKHYRRVMDSKGAKRRTLIREASRQFGKLGNRDYTTGFAFGLDEKIQNYDSSRNRSAYHMVGEYGDNEKAASVPEAALGHVLADGGRIYPLRVHNVIKKGESIEAISICDIKKITVKRVFNHKGEERASAHGGTRHLWYIELNQEVQPWTIFRSSMTDK